MSAEVVARDEVAELKRALVDGDWRRVADPLLPFALMQDPGDWWIDALGSILYNLPRSLFVDQYLPDTDPTIGALVDQWHRSNNVEYRRLLLQITRLILADCDVPFRREALIRGDVTEHRRALAILEAFAPV